MKIVTVVGARPQFIKAAVGSRQIRKEHEEVLVHTGQHYDYNMSGLFFDELDIPKPDYNLGIYGGSHAKMTADMLKEIEHILIKEKPDALLIYGDTNSTLAGALAAVKLQIPVIHVEAGGRLGALSNPEEVNRIVADHLSTLCFCANEDSMKHLENEGLKGRAYFVGNIMYDAFLYYSQKQCEPHLYDFADGEVDIPKEYYYMTCHRQENTYDDTPLTEILMGMNDLDAPTVYPVHPRNQERALRIVNDFSLNNVILIKPVSYLESIYLLKGCKKVVTDSGGLQTEAFFAKKQCVFVFERVAWPETMVGNRNQLAKADRHDIKKKLSVSQRIDDGYMPFGNGHAAEKICEIIRRYEGDFR